MVFGPATITVVPETRKGESGDWGPGCTLLAGDGIESNKLGWLSLPLLITGAGLTHTGGINPQHEVLGGGTGLCSSYSFICA
jgi:hypothetical protein